MGKIVPVVAMLDWTLTQNTYLVNQTYTYLYLDDILQEEDYGISLFLKAI